MIPEIKFEITFLVLRKGILFYTRDNISSNLVKLYQKFENFGGFFVELELCKKNKWSLSYSYNPRKGNKNNTYLISARA